MILEHDEKPSDILLRKFWEAKKELLFVIASPAVGMGVAIFRMSMDEISKGERSIP